MDREKEFFLKLRNFKITREEFIKQIEKTRGKYTIETFNHLIKDEDILYSEIIDHCLFWKITSQGYDFWSKIHYEINEMKAIKRKIKNIKFKTK